MISPVSTTVTRPFLGALALHGLRPSAATGAPRLAAMGPSRRAFLSAALASQSRRGPTSASAPSPILSAHSRRTFMRASSPLRAANPQSGKPASDNLEHMTKNIKEELSQVASSLTSGIAGSSGSGKDAKTGGQRGGDGSSGEGAVSGAAELLSEARSITSEMAKAVPQPALVWGAAGIIPYISTSAASVYLARQAWMVEKGLDTHLDLDTALALLHHAQSIQVGYGATILAFLGAIHWGFEFSKYGGALGNRRYALGVFPIFVAAPSLLLAPQLALVSQFAAYVAMWFIDLRATVAGWAPSWYSTYRFWLTAFVGSSIVLTLAGTQYYDADWSRSSQRTPGSRLEANVKKHAKEKIESQYRSAKGIKEGPKIEQEVESSDVITQSAGADADGYIKIRDLKKEEEERKKKEEEEKKKKEEAKKGGGEKEEKKGEKKEKKDDKPEEKKDDKQEEKKDDKQEEKEEGGKGEKKDGKKDE